jgi:predicted protein tyrosine phosphatase
MKPRILFVCGRNKWRSPTAERLYADDARVEVRSAGMSDRSRHRVSHADLEWADLVLVMEDEYGARLRDQFASVRLPVIRSLEIPDEYEYMDDRLVELIRSGVEPHIRALTQQRD